MPRLPMPLPPLKQRPQRYPLGLPRRLPIAFELMQKALEIFKTYRDEIIRLEALELGAPVSYSANAHCDYQFTRIESYIRESQKVVLEEQFEQSTVVREPIGVIACITPWNYPLGQVVQKIIPALLMGNTVVLKPSQHTPLTAYLLVDSLDRAGFPAGTVNLITGRGSKLGDTLATHPLVDMISLPDRRLLASSSVKRLWKVSNAFLWSSVENRLLSGFRAKTMSLPSISSLVPFSTTPGKLARH